MPATSWTHLHDPVMEVSIMPDPQNEPTAQAKLHWYRIPLERAVLAELNQRSDAWGVGRHHCHPTPSKAGALLPIRP
jgi:hypothetical protein